MDVGLQFSAPDYLPPQVQSAGHFTDTSFASSNIPQLSPPTTCVEVATQTDWWPQEELSKEEGKEAARRRADKRNNAVVTGTILRTALPEPQPPNALSQLV